MRRLLALILCLLIPLQGFATMRVVAMPCPMQSGMTMSVDVSELADALQDCCNDAAAFERTGQTCKPGQNFAAPVAWMPPLKTLEFQAQSAPSLSEPVWREHPPGQPTRLWRPPTSI